jgi:hypothetical protein
MVRERDAAGTTRQLEAWVHRRGLASLQAFRRGAVPELLSAVDDAWLEGCLHEPLEQRLLKLAGLAPAPPVAASEAVAPEPVASEPVASELLTGEHGIGFGGSPTGQGSPLTPPNDQIEVAVSELPLPLPPAVSAEAAVLEAFGQESIEQETIGLEAFGLQPFEQETIGLEAFGLQAFEQEAIGLETVGLEAIELDSWAAPMGPHHNLPEPLPNADCNAHQDSAHQDNAHQGSAVLAEGSAQAPTEARAEVAAFDTRTEVSSGACSEAVALDHRAETSPGAWSELPALDSDGVAAAGSGPLDTAGGEGAWSLLAELPERQEPDNQTTFSPFEAIASAPVTPTPSTPAPVIPAACTPAPSTPSTSTPAPGAESGAALQGREPTTNLPTTAEPSRHQGLERGLSAAGTVLADAPQRLRRKLFGSFGKARLLMRACLEEAISTLHPHGDTVPQEEEEQAPQNIATPAAGDAAARERLGSSWPGAGTPAAAAAQPSGDPFATPNTPWVNTQGANTRAANTQGEHTHRANTNGPNSNGPEPIGAAPQGAAPLAAWSRSRGNALPGGPSLVVPLQGPPAPAPAHLADLRAWLPGSSDQDRRAS